MLSITNVRIPLIAQNTQHRRLLVCCCCCCFFLHLKRTDKLDWANVHTAFNGWQREKKIGKIANNGIGDTYLYTFIAINSGQIEIFVSKVKNKFCCRSFEIEHTNTKSINSARGERHSHTPKMDGKIVRSLHLSTTRVKLVSAPTPRPKTQTHIKKNTIFCVSKVNMCIYIRKITNWKNNSAANRKSGNWIHSVWRAVGQKSYQLFFSP